jgi:hypothetical protein
MLKTNFKDCYQLKLLKMKTRSVLFILALFMTSMGLQAQSKHHHHRGAGLFGAIENAKADLNLTEDQAAQLDELKANFDQEKQALKDQEFENGEDHRQAAKTLNKKYRDQIHEILTDEQVSILKEKRKSQAKEKHERIPSEDRKKLKAELKQYHDSNIKPVMLEARKDFDEKISAADKEELADLRARFAAKKEARKQEFKEQKANSKEGKHQKRHGRHHNIDKDNPDHQALKALVDKYDAEIEEALSSLKPAHDQWDAERKAIISKYMPEVDGDKSHGFDGHGLKRKMPGMRKGHFLLMDPNDVTTTALPVTSVIENAKAYPNPASNQLTLSYTLLTDSEVVVEWQNEQGRSAQVLENTFKTAGEYELTIDVSSYRDGVHYINLICDGQRTVVKALIAK